MAPHSAQHPCREGGFSLIELLVAVSIFSVLAASALPHIDTRREDIQTVTRQVIADYRWARTRAITSGDHFAVEWLDPQRYQVQRLKQNTSGAWALDTVVKDVTLPEHISVTWWWPAKHEFNTRGMMITTTYPLWQLLWDEKFSGWHIVSLWPSGQVYEEY